jgi:hypothetical protein
MIPPEVLVFHTWADNCPGVLVPVEDYAGISICAECLAVIEDDAPEVLAQLATLK